MPQEIPRAHADEMINIFPRLKREAIEQEVTLSSGWVASFRKRLKGGGDVYVTKSGEAPLRSREDVRRRFNTY